MCYPVNYTSASATGLNTRVRVRDLNRSRGEAVGHIYIQAVGAGDDEVARNKKVVAESERRIRLCEARLRKPKHQQQP